MREAPKIVSTMLSLMLLWSCSGTEVGNGRSGPAPQATNVEDNSPPLSPGSEEAPKASASPTSGGHGTAPESSAPSPLPFLLAQCGSPFAEGQPGRFVVTPSGEDLVIEAAASGAWNITLESQKVQVAPSPSAGKPFAVMTSYGGSQIPCLGYEVAGMQRTIRFANGYETTWSLDAQGRLDEIIVRDPKHATVLTYKRK
jgi:hypothetical protein